VERVLDALARLSPDDRASIDEVITRSSTAAPSARVRSKLHRARQRLRAALEEGS
jgi:hypothetical protein